MSQFTKGLWLDGHPLTQPEGTYRDANNVTLTRFEGCVSQAEGTVLADSLPAGHRMIGSAPTPDGDTVLFSVGGSGALSKAKGHISISEGTGTPGAKARTVFDFTTDMPSTGERADWWFSLRTQVPPENNELVNINFDWEGKTFNSSGVAYPPLGVISSPDWILSLSAWMDQEFPDKWGASWGGDEVARIFAKNEGSSYNGYGLTNLNPNLEINSSPPHQTTGGTEPDQVINQFVQFNVNTTFGTYQFVIVVRGLDTASDLRDKVYNAMMGDLAFLNNFIVTKDDSSIPRLIIEANDTGSLYNHTVGVFNQGKLPPEWVAFQTTPGWSQVNFPLGINVVSGGNTVQVAPLSAGMTPTQVATQVQVTLNSSTVWPWDRLVISRVGPTLYFEADDTSTDFEGLSVVIDPLDTSVQYSGSIISGGGVSNYNSRIGLFKRSGDTGEYVPIRQDGLGDLQRMGFHLDYPIQATVKKDRQGNNIVYWVDGLNSARFLKIDESGPLVGRSDELQLFGSLDTMPSITVDGINNAGGTLQSGAYQVAIALVDSVGGTRTPFMWVSNPVSIMQPPIGGRRTTHGSEPGSGTSKAIRATIEGLDSRYRFYVPALIRGADVRILNQRPIVGDSSEIVITGGEAYVPGALEEIVIDPVSYERPSAITQDQNILYLGGGKRVEDIGYQKFANSIKSELVLDTFPVMTSLGYAGHSVQIPVYTGHPDDMRNPSTAVLKGFKRGEVYAFYISFMLEDGSETPAYHIPGRAEINGDKEPASSNAAAVGAGFKFQVGTTTMPEGSGMGFWENDSERYPNEANDLNGDFEIWTTDASGSPYPLSGTLHGQKVRHHAFPDNSRISHQVGQVGSPGENYARTMGVRFSGISVPSNLPKKVIGYKIYYANRSPINSRWLGQSPLSYAKAFDGDASRLWMFGTSDGATPTNGIVGAAPFEMMRKKVNAGFISYIKEAFKTDSNLEYMLPGFNGPGDSNRLRPVRWAGYIDANTNVTVGQPGVQLVNTPGSESLVMQIEDMWGKESDVVDLFSFKKDVYEPFYAQDLVFSGHGAQVESPGLQPDSPDIFGGDTFISYYGMWRTTPAQAGGIQDIEGWRALQQVVVETTDNIGLRHEGELENEISWPIGGDYITGDPDIVAEAINSDNIEFAMDYIGYNDEYSLQNVLKPAFPSLPYEKRIEDRPNLIARSAPEDPNYQTDHFRRFLANDYIEVTGQKGKIVKLAAFSGGLIIHCERTLFTTMGREELAVDNLKAFIGSGDILGQKPKEMFPIDEGFGGISDPRHSVMSPAGYVFLDLLARKVYILSDGVRCISDDGMRKFFDTNLKETHKSQVRLGVDPEYNKIYIGKFGSKVVAKTDGSNFTLSFIPGLEAWESFHSLDPDWYFWDNGRMFMVRGDQIHTRLAEEDNEGRYFGDVGSLEIQVSDNSTPTVNKVVQSVEINSVVTVDGSEVNDRTFDSIEVSSDHETTGIVPINYFANGGNARRINRVWKVNGIRSNELVGDSLNAPWLRRRMIGKYHLVRILHNNPGNEVMRLFWLSLKTGLSQR